MKRARRSKKKELLFSGATRGKDTPAPLLTRPSFIKQLPKIFQYPEFLPAKRLLPRMAGWGICFEADLELLGGIAPQKPKGIQMAQVKIQSIIEHLDYDMKRALEEAVSRVSPDSDIDRNELYREFRRSVGRKCSTWVSVADHDVEIRCRRCGEKT